MDAQGLTTLLTGQYVRLWPYTPEAFPRDALYQVWQAIEAEHGWGRIFWWERLPDAQKGRLAVFAAYMQDTIPLLVEARTRSDLVGLIWFTETFQGLRTNGNIWYAKRAWGPAADEATALATRYAHQALRLPQVWAVTPWKAARQHVLRCGFKDVATLPRYVRMHDKPMPMYFLLHEE